MNVNENIKKLRKEKGLSQQKLAELIGKSKSSVEKYESGLISNIPKAVLEKIANVLDSSVSSLLCGEFDFESARNEFDEFESVEALLKVFGYKLEHIFISVGEDSIDMVKMEDYKIKLTNTKLNESKIINGLEYQQFIDKLKHFIDFEFYCMQK